MISSVFSNALFLLTLYYFTFRLHFESIFALLFCIIKCVCMIYILGKDGGGASGCDFVTCKFGPCMTCTVTPPADGSFGWRRT